MAQDFIVTGASYKPRRIIDRQNAAYDADKKRMCYESASQAFKAAVKRKKETGQDFSVWIHNKTDPFATTATWALVDNMKWIK